MAFSKLLIVGLDSAAPTLVFDRWRDELPTLAGLIARGAHGRMLSTHPPITVPAWTSMMSSRDPGELGFYGFRNRKDHSYDGYAFANSAQVKVPRLWDWLGKAGLHTVVLGVPQTYPPSPVNGEMVTCFLTPSTKSEYTYPPSLKPEVERVTEGYVLDVEDFRTADKAGLLRRIYAKTDKHLRLANPPRKPTPIGQVAIDWGKTQAWGDGGYYGRLFMNVKGREPSGTIAPADYERVRTDLVAGIEAISDPRGRNIGSRAYRPENLYRSLNGVAPDLLVYFGDLDWRSVGAVGTGGIHTFENDTGPDEANHDWHGIFILSTAGAEAPLRGRLPDVSIYDIAPTVLRLMGQPLPDALAGRPLH